MKKSRPAWMISALCLEGDVAEAEQILFTQTTTFGIRRRRCDRRKLQRAHVTVETHYGPIRVKLGRLGEAKSIYEDFITANPQNGWTARFKELLDDLNMKVKEGTASVAPVTMDPARGSAQGQATPAGTPGRKSGDVVQGVPEAVVPNAAAPAKK